MRRPARGTVPLACFLFFCFFFSSMALAQDELTLDRRPYLGLALQALPPPDQGLLVTRVFPGSSASEAGIAEGDFVLRLNDKPLSAPDDLIQSVKKCKVGAILQLETLRKGKVIARSVSLKSFPVETSPDFEVIYGSIKVDGFHRRTIITRPKIEGRFPAVLLVGGIGCYSVDYPLDKNNAYKLLLYGLARKNTVTMCIEKSGMGDSQGPPCSGQDFRSEVHAYEQALKSLGGMDFVDRGKIFIFGHSIGGIIAPLLAEGFPLRGIIVANTVGISWFEYELENARRQHKLAGLSPEEIDRRLRQKELALHLLLVEKKPFAQILEQNPELKESLSYPASSAYMQQVAELNLPGLWRAVSCPVLVIFGRSDFVTTEREHSFIVQQVNAAHPGHATFMPVRGMDHFLTRAETMQDSYKKRSADKISQPGKFTFDSSIVPRISDWLLRVCSQDLKEGSGVGSTGGATHGIAPTDENMPVR